jgi:maltooligosyltrehalose trehalohydrolase
VTEGRRAEFASFASFKDTDAIPDPQEHDTFRRSRLQWDEIDRAPHAGVLRLYQRALDLRRSHPALRARGRPSFDAGVIDDHTLWLRRSNADGSDPVLAVVKLSGGAARVPVERGWGTVVLTTEDPAFVDAPRAIAFDRDAAAVEFDRPGALLLGLPVANQSSGGDG